MQQLTHTGLDNCSIGVIIVDKSHCISFCNSWIVEASRLDREKIIGRNINEVFSEALSRRFLRALDGAIQGKTSVLSQKLNKSPLPLYRTDNLSEQERMLELTVMTPLKLEDGENYCMVQVFDVTESVRKENSLHSYAQQAKQSAAELGAKEAKMRAILEGAKDCIILIRQDGSIESFNHCAISTFGYSRERILQLRIQDLVEDIAVWQNKYSKDVHQLFEEWRVRSDAQELTGLTSDNMRIPIDFSINSMEIEDEYYYVAVVRDITERKKAEARLEYMARFDALTDLANRTLLRNKLKHALNEAQENDGLVAVMFLDLDRFKFVNDTFGHAEGDEMLKQVAARLCRCVQEFDTVARQGGDEFVILIQSAKTREKLERIANRVLDSFKQPFIIKTHELQMSTSLGIAVNTTGNESADDMIRHADTAMYEAKEDPQAPYLFFEEEMNHKAARRLIIEQDLRKAISHQQFKLYFQPQYSVEKQEIAGAEALIRWIHPERGFISPEIFIPIAEDTGIILEIGKWVIEQTCLLAAELKQMGYGHLKLGVNISPRQFSDSGFMNHLVTHVRKHQLSPAQIDIEITEGMLMGNTQEAITILNRLANAGFPISIDDFGTGYSSLSYLRKFPIDTLKIDRSFILDLPTEENDDKDSGDAAAISQAIISLAHSLRMSVIAEGVENKEHLQFLERNQCEEIQGYLFSKPLPKGQFIEWLKQFNPQDYI